MDYTEAYIESLIKCRKAIVEPPTKEMKLEKKHKRNDMKLKSLDMDDQFYVFMRIHIDFQENFSIGLLHQSLEGPKNILLRFNGNHGQVVEDPIKPNPHFGYHIHKTTSDDLNNGFFEPKLIVSTSEYASFKEALKYFFNFVNITDAYKHFRHIFKKKLFNNEII
ncbi:MAG: hypothetical protein FJ264_05540 [Planctomycetes bacterium]|nr:hypothetical protein [Planctomycetota bacterium]